MSPLRKLVVQLLIAIVTIATAPAYCCADVIYASDFEQPSFAPGLLAGQDPWEGLFGVDAAMITDVQPRFGVQSIQIDGATLEPCCGNLVGSHLALPLHFDAVVNNFHIINIFADVRLDGPSTDTDLISANLTARTRPNRPIAGMLLSSSGEVLAHQLAAPVDLGQYSRLGLRLDYEKQEREFFVNGNSLGVLPFSSPDPVLSTVSLELLAIDNPAVIDPSEYTAYFDNLVITEGDVVPPHPGALLPGDADMDLDFDQLDLVKVQIADKYRTGTAATWGEGDWNGAPGGKPGNPPPGDGMFDQLDIVAALAGGAYLAGPYGALAPEPGDPNDDQTSLVYNTGTGELGVNAPVSTELASINIDSQSGKFIGEKPDILASAFDNFDTGNIFKVTFGGSFGSIGFGQVLPAGLSQDELVADLRAVGSLLPRPGGGPLGPVDLILVGNVGGAPQLLAGDSNMDLKFDQRDLVQVQIAAKYLSGQAATWGDGDWNGAPGGEQGNPPSGDGMFDQLDIIAALGSGHYLTGAYAAINSGGAAGDGQTSVIYNPTTGELAVDAPANTELTSINIDSADAILTSEPAQNRGGSFDNDADNNIFKATFGSSFGSLSFGNVARAGLSEPFVLNDLSVVGSLQGGGALGDVDLIYIPEPSAAVLLGLGLIGAVLTMSRKGSSQPLTNRALALPNSIAVEIPSHLGNDSMSDTPTTHQDA